MNDQEKSWCRFGIVTTWKYHEVCCSQAVKLSRPMKVGVTNSIIANYEIGIDASSGTDSGSAYIHFT